MKILPINNKSQSNSTFRATFPRKQVQEMVQEIAVTNEPEGLAQLYTLLKYAKEIPGKVLLLKQGTVTQQRNNCANTVNFLISDNARKLGHSFKDRKFDALLDICVKKDKQTSHSEFIRMPQSVFEREWWNNRHVNERDVLNLSLVI